MSHSCIHHAALAALTLLLLLGTASASAEFYLKDGDSVVFYGDSITEQRLYTTYTEAFVVMRYPKLDVALCARGVGGDRVSGGWMGPATQRVPRDVKPEKPTVITIMLGMNDGGYVPYDPKILSAYQDGYGQLLGLLQNAAPRARFTLIGTSPYDEWAHPDAARKGYNDTLLKYVDHVKWRADRIGGLFVDFNAPVTQAIHAAIAASDPKANAFVPDTVHPGPGGQLVMAAALLKGWSADGVVSNVVIDAASGALVQADYTRIQDLVSADASCQMPRHVAWIQKDLGLPFPTNADMELAVKYSDFTDALNREALTVRGLEPGTYRLEIDSKVVAELPAEEWAKGVNLALLETPMRAQAEQVLAQTFKRNDALFTRWRNVEFQLADYHSSKRAASALKKVEKEIQRKQHRLAQPKSHRYRLLKLS